MSGLYDPAATRGSCGIAALARLDGRRRRETVERAIAALGNLEHRGAAGADPETGDGAGIMLQLPHGLFRDELPLPRGAVYGVAMCFLPPDSRRRADAECALVDAVREHGQRVVTWRDVPIDRSAAGRAAMEAAPAIRQLFIAAPVGLPEDEFERKLYLIRRSAESAAPDLHVASCSARTIVYKGMLTAPQLAPFYPDLRDTRTASALAIVHSRFSTNTLPSWELAHPYRMLAHNGEINTVRGNVNWLRARERRLVADLVGGELERLLPVVRDGSSDSESLDSILELLVHSGRPLPHALMMLIPEAWEGRDDLPPELRDFYAYHAGVIEPWDGPAAVVFSDGRVLGATLDRNGLRPGRWAVTHDGWVALASEAGAFRLAPESIARRGRLRPGTLFMVDLRSGRVMADREVEHEVATARPYGAWMEGRSVRLSDLPPAYEPLPPLGAEPDRLRRAFGYTLEDVRQLIAPMAADGKEPTGSMGADNALAVLSRKRPPLFSFFKQLFAQVTNPAIDPIRESVVTSLATNLSGCANLLSEGPVHAEQIVLDSPVLDGEAFRRLLSPSRAGPELAHVDITWPASEGAGGMAPALERIVSNAQEAIAAGARVLVLSDRTASEERVALPSLLAVAAVHAQLVRDGTRLEAGVVLDSGEPREVHHFACLIGFGATAVHPYLLLETAGDDSDAVLDALAKGLLKVMSKLGISSVSSYRGAQAFEAVGLAREVIDAHFPGTGSRLAGAGLERIAADAFGRHADAFAAEEARLPVGGVLNWRRDGERHMWSPATVVRLRDAARDGGAEDWERFRDAADAEAAGATLRGLLELRAAPEPLPLDDVEPATEIVKRFATGAMSLGSISPEAHETLAIAMNRLGGKSNTGEGGEDPRRFTADENGDLRRSAIKQVASARFGVTIDYLVNADELQIKIAQGAKPGEGGQLPGHKVDDFIGRLRHSTPGVELISPPPHHDIYSIEDIKQLIHDLRCANPEARISVKLAAELGVGTVAAGVVKAHTEHLVIAGHDGGTGASPVSSIQAAGIPWELGLAETQQTLVANGLRERVVLQVDGGLKTGRDVVVGALLGAEEFGFSTAPLIALGCIMMRVCHLNTCPVGIATQDPELRRRFDGQPEHVTRYLLLVAEDARRHMARLGVARFDDLIGRPDLLDGDTAAARAAAVDLGDVLAVEEGPARHRPGAAVIPRPDPLDIELFEAAQPAIERGERISFRAQIRNVDRSIGARLSGAAAKAKWHGSVDAEFHGSAGQSFGAWLAPGIEFSLVGEANDYAGKGLSGGVLAVRLPSPNPGDVIVGNTVLYGATSGRAFFAGVAGERFAVRNSGAWAVAEGVGDHGCEYMTGGRVAVLGRTGRNFAAGMTGGAAWVLDDDGGFALRCNRELVELSDLDDADADELWGLLGEHVERTGSPLAADLLADWAHAVRNFVSVVPRGYREALEEERAHEKVAA